MNLLKKENFYNNEMISYLGSQYDIHSAIILNNIGKPKYIYVDGNKLFKTCRFCNNNEDQVTFNNKSHIVPKFLGNFLILSNFECDECNSFFSKYETELEKYIKIPLIANLKDKDLKDRYGKNIKRVNGEIIIDGDKEKVEFNSIYVLKILLKFAMSMINEEDIINYKEILNTLKTDDIPKITNILDITSRYPFDWNSVILYENKFKDNNLVDNLLILNLNMKKYVVFFNKDNNNIKVNDKIINQDYINLFKDLDIYNYKIRNFNNDNMQIKFNLKFFMPFLI